MSRSSEVMTRAPKQKSKRRYSTISRLATGGKSHPTWGRATAPPYRTGITGVRDRAPFSKQNNTRLQMKKRVTKSMRQTPKKRRRAGSAGVKKRARGEEERG